jgi:hypothetical protein
LARFCASDPAKDPNVKYASSMWLRFVDLKTRLTALWHQSLARSREISQLDSILELEQWGTEEIGYTAETNRFAGKDGRTNLVRHFRVLGGSQ